MLNQIQTIKPGKAGSRSRFAGGHLRAERERNAMTKNIATVLGVIFIIVGLLGFAAPNLMGMHLTVVHNLIHLASGALALYFGRSATLPASRTFCVVFGVVYGLLGLIGFAAGGAERMLTLIPDQLVLGMMDHVIHLILGAVFLFAGLYRRPALAGPPLP
jgi:hypothetical protein